MRDGATPPPLTAAPSHLLEHLHEGVAIVDRSGRLGSEHSRALERIVGDPPSGELAWSYFMRVDADFAQTLCFAWEGLADGALPVDAALAQLPRTMRAGSERYHLDVAPISSDQFLLVLRNVTAELEREERAQVERELGALLQELARDPKGFVEQLAEIDALVATLGLPDIALPAFKRALHTLKGAAAMLRLASIATACHAMEDRLDEEDAPPPLTHYAKLRAQWLALREPVASLLDARRDCVEVDRRDLEELTAAIRSGVARAHLLARARELGLERADRRLRWLADHAAALAAAVGKAVEVDIDAGRVRVDPAHAAFWSSLVHLVRNAIAHGIEAPDERVAAGKPRAGRIELACEDDGEHLVFRAHDDGRGFDWDALRSVARARGLDAADPRSLVTRGLSRLSQPDELAGRGEGLHAVFAAARALGGEGTIDSATGRGATLTFVVPHLVAIEPPVPSARSGA